LEVPQRLAGLCNTKLRGAKDPEGARNVEALFCCLQCGAGLSDDCPKPIDDGSLSEDVWRAFFFLLRRADGRRAGAFLTL